MLHSLQHPCIVSMLGISIHPLCFALQLAPLGSLNTVLEENRLGKSKNALIVPLLFVFLWGNNLCLFSRLWVHASWPHADL